MPGRDVVVVGFSAGGVEAIARLTAGLPRNFPAAILVVHHFPGNSVSALPSILRRSGRLSAAHPEHNEAIEAGRIYVPPPDRHMLVVDGRIHLTRGPRENGNRPGIPESAIERLAVDHVLPVEAIGQLLTRLTREPVAIREGTQPMLPEDEKHHDPAEAGTADVGSEKAS